MSTLVPPLFAGLVDDASTLAPGVTTIAEALSAHAQHAAAWYRDLLGSFLLPASLIGRDVAPAGDDEKDSGGDAGSDSSGSDYSY